MDKGAVENLIDESRVMSFSDAVFAFAATLLVLKIELPAIAPEQLSAQLPGALIELWPAYLANIISFLVIGYYWLNHHVIFGLLKRFNQTIVWLNLVFLISIAFLPFPVDLFGDYSTEPIVVVLYTASLALVGYLLAGMWWYVSSSHRLIDKSLSPRHIRFYTLNILMAPVIFTLSLPLVYVHPLLTQAFWVLVVIGVWVVNHSFNYKRLSEMEKETV